MINDNKSRKKRNQSIRMRRTTVGVLMIGVFFVFITVFILSQGDDTDKEEDMVQTGGVQAGVDKETGSEGNQKEGIPEISVPQTVEPTPEPKEDMQAKQRREETIARAELLAAAYDYDAATDLIRTIEGYETDTALQEKITAYEAEKASCLPVNMDEVTHVFYHTLVVDPERAFANQDKDPQAVGNNQWMTTVSEFLKITEEMYDRGYVIVGIHDLIDVTTDENGKTVYKPAQIMLPPGKRAYVLSQDDLCYYHSYDNYGYAAKMVLDENGKPVCEYIQADGTRVTGAYDVVSLLDEFIEEHPDASYRGAKGIIALTGYNGILGYRTDSSYLDINGDLNEDKKAWLRENPDFDIEKERAEAKKVAEALKEDGWEFASHTWGHIRIADSSLERLMTDTKKWRENVEPLVGPTDTIIFAHGQDLGKWGGYDESEAKYKYLREQGYDVFCNVDSNLYRTWFGTDYLRQGRRNLDGYRIYKNMIGMEDNVSDLFDAAEVIDPLRPPVPLLP